MPIEMKLNTNRTRPNRLRDPKLNQSHEIPNKLDFFINRVA